MKRYMLIYSMFLLAMLTSSISSVATEKKTTQKKAPAKSSSTTSTKEDYGISREPYLGAIVVDATTGKVLIEANPDVKAYPASMTKMMVLLVILDRVEQGVLKAEEKVNVTAEASRTGGSQVYLKEKEQFTLDELLYALMVQSANDAAVALAIHVAGSKEAFVELMNKKAVELGMNSTEFHSVHGLPPDKRIGQKPDVSTPRDIAVLSRELLKRPQALQYTSTKERVFRENPKFIMTSHNKLLWNVTGCDGLKTGYFKEAGYSIAATATQNNRRVIVVIMGALASDAKMARARGVQLQNTRDQKASELMAAGFAKLREISAKPVKSSSDAASKKAN